MSNRLLALTVAVAAAGIAIAAQAQQGTAISGRVVSAATGQPIAGARVGSNAADVGLSATTDAQGNYSLNTLSWSGRYVVRASAAGYVDAVYGDDPDLGPLIISTAQGRQPTGVDFALQRGATIAGRVIDDAKEPLVKARVTAVTERWFSLAKARRYSSYYSAETNDRGEFRLIGLAPGEYAIAVHDRGSVTFAPSTTSLKDARRITVGVGELIEGVAVQSRAGASGSIKGHVVGVVGANARIWLRLASPDRIASDVSAPLQLGGSFLLDNLAPGRYSLIVRPALAPIHPRSWARQSVLVNAGAETEQIVNLAEGANITGRVTGPSPYGRDISLAPLDDLDHPEAARVQVRSAADGTFRLQGIPPGRYRWLRTQESIFHLSVYEGTSPIDIADLVFTANAGESRELRVEAFTGSGATIGGIVTGGDGKPTTAGGVIIAAADSRYWTSVSRRLLITRADQLGYFEASRLPAGDYFVVHVSQLAPGQLWDTAFLKKTLAGAQRVTVAAGDVQKIDVTTK